MRWERPARVDASRGGRHETTRPRPATFVPEPPPRPVASPSFINPTAHRPVFPVMRPMLGPFHSRPIQSVPTLRAPVPLCRRLGRGVAVVLALAAILDGCSSGNNGGGCTTDVQCKDTRICVKGACVNPTSPGGSDSGTPHPDSGSVVPNEDASGAEDDGGGDRQRREHLLHRARPRHLLLRARPVARGDDRAELHGGARRVGVGVLRDTGWPSSGDCSCNSPAFCEQDYDTCECNLGQDGMPLAGDTVVSTCTYNGSCCTFGDGFGIVGCACYTETNIDCSVLQGTPTGSCGPSESRLRTGDDAGQRVPMSCRRMLREANVPRGQ